MQYFTHTAILSCTILTLFIHHVQGISPTEEVYDENYFLEHLPKFENLSKITAMLEDKKLKAASFGKVNYQQACRSEYPIVYDPTLPFLCSTLKQKPNLCNTHYGERK